MPPTQMPASGMARSARFYNRVFHWNIQQSGDGHLLATTVPAK